MRNLLVAAELELELAGAAGKRAQAGGVVGDLGVRDGRLNRGRAGCDAVAGAHALDATATCRHIAHHGAGVAVCGAEAIFTQLGADLSLPQLALIASELCGSYGITPMSDDAVSYNLQPLSTINDLMAYAEGAKALGIRGASRAVNALRVTSELAASPREAQIAVFLSLSRRRGGADLPGFELNKTIKVPADMIVIVGSKTLKPDILWEHEKLILEYDSNEFHLTVAQKRRDEARRRVYERLGYKVKCLTSDILADNGKLNVFVDELETVISPRRRKANQQMLATRRELRADLFGPERPNRAHFHKTDWA